MIVINKPSGMPVHPAGRYNFNSVIEIMRAERNGFNPLRKFYYSVLLFSIVTGEIGE